LAGEAVSETASETVSETDAKAVKAGTEAGAEVGVEAGTEVEEAGAEAGLKGVAESAPQVAGETVAEDGVKGVAEPGTNGVVEQEDGAKIGDGAVVLKIGHQAVVEAGAEVVEAGAETRFKGVAESAPHEVRIGNDAIVTEKVIDETILQLDTGDPGVAEGDTIGVELSGVQVVEASAEAIDYVTDAVTDAVLETVGEVGVQGGIVAEASGNTGVEGIRQIGAEVVAAEKETRRVGGTVGAPQAHGDLSREWAGHNPHEPRLFPGPPQ
jgi:hypothetical protein